MMRLRRQAVGVIFTVVIAMLLIFSSAAQAISLNISAPDVSSITLGESITFRVAVDIMSSERIPLENVTINVSSTNTSRICTFAMNGTPIDGCDNITITQVTPSLPSSQFSGTTGALLTGISSLGNTILAHSSQYTSSSMPTEPQFIETWGYGYGYNYGYGYGYGYSGGILEYEITLIPEETGDYTINFFTSASNGAVFHNLAANEQTFTVRPEFINISTCEQLQNVSLDLTAKYRLTDNIDCAGNAFEPIGHNFRGSFDGQNYSIYNLNISTEENETLWAGLFARNLGTIKDVHVGGSVTGACYVAGIAAVNRGAISGSSFTGDITGLECSRQWSYIGGLVGMNIGRDAFINTSSAQGTVDGRLADNIAFVGGLVGENIGGIDNSYASSTVFGGSFTGGFVGKNYNLPYVYVRTSYSQSTLGGNGQLNGFIGANFATVENSYYDSNVSNTTAQVPWNRTTEQLKNSSTFDNWDFDVWDIVEGNSTPSLHDLWIGGVTSTVGVDWIALSWTNPTHSSFVGVEIFIDNDSVILITNGSTSYNITGLDSGESYTIDLVPMSVFGTSQDPTTKVLTTDSAPATGGGGGTPTGTGALTITDDPEQIFEAPRSPVGFPAGEATDDGAAAGAGDVETDETAVDAPGLGGLITGALPGIGAGLLGLLLIGGIVFFAAKRRKRK